eukprot:TCALIF_11060-PA protein Name:"Similar to nAChRalpha1 Acetylcholine receptor subunit alpha-like 1 (Drosophila melanogaster)" AED:0.06 eAED:0.13 QI:122/0.5/0.66/1/0.5/0.66/3/0/265
METRVLFALFFVSAVLGQESNDTASMTISDIKQRLLENHDSDSKPQGRIDLQFGLNGLWFDLDRQGILKGSVWLRLKWNDERLAWNYGEYEKYANSSEMIHVDPSQIWVPDVILFNRYDAASPMGSHKRRGAWSDALIMPNGDVIVVPNIAIEAVCEDATLTDIWAVQNCTLRFGSWTHSGYHMNISFLDIGGVVDMSDYLRTSPMARKEKTYECCPEPYVSMDVKLVLQRKFVFNENGMVENPYFDMGHDHGQHHGNSNGRKTI